jgi:DUF3017 family protein
MTPRPGRRGRPQTLGGATYLTVLAATVLGVAIAAAGRPRAGVAWVGVALVAGAVVRMLLPQSAAGMLGLRHKVIDVAWMGALGIALVVVALSLRLFEVTPGPVVPP